MINLIHFVNVFKNSLWEYLKINLDYSIDPEIANKVKSSYKS